MNTSVDSIINNTETFRYMFLSRLIMDCKYYLGNGNRNEEILWAKDVKEHLALIKAIRESFPDEKKPEWLTEKQLGEFESAMLN